MRGMWPYVKGRKLTLAADLAASAAHWECIRRHRLPCSMTGSCSAHISTGSLCWPAFLKVRAQRNQPELYRDLSFSEYLAVEPGRLTIS